MVQGLGKVEQLTPISELLIQAREFNEVIKVCLAVESGDEMSQGYSSSRGRGRCLR
jgi:hypothetical protein